jgi:hypothetical protein
VNGENRPLSDLAFDKKTTAMAVDDVLDDGQSEARSPDRTAAPDIDAVEPLCEARNVLTGNTFPAILY